MIVPWWRSNKALVLVVPPTFTYSQSNFSRGDLIVCTCGELANVTYHALQSVVEYIPYRAEIARSRAAQDEVRHAQISAS